MVNWKNVTPDEMYEFIKKHGTSIKHDIAIDRLVKKHTKKELINELSEFGLVTPAKHIINMYSRKKVTKIDDASKRMIAFASYNLALYIKQQERNLNPYHVKFPDKIYIPKCSNTLDKKGLDEAIKNLFKNKKR